MPRPRRARTAAVALTLALLASAEAAADEVHLGIPDRPQAAAAPSAGWCGESAIQQALLYHGAFYPQADIHAAGSPQHADLYASEIPGALDHLHVRYRRYPWANRGFDRFKRWLERQLDGGRPVLAGMKIHPTRHPTWSLDHFVLVVGYDADHLAVNTTWGETQQLPLGRLGSRQVRGLSFGNRYDRYWAIRVDGLEDADPEARPVRLTVLAETDEHLDAIVTCADLTVGERYRVARYARVDAVRPVRSVEFTASLAAYAFHDRIDKGRPAIFRCHPVALPPAPEGDAGR